ncbi:MAG: phosphatidate cytidylyltransferase [Dehalococcoidales bacterium]|nr:phosphatidate cytidylyltransferase [Dehalococcoidales bacterium]
MLKPRLIISFILIPIVIAIVWFGEPWFPILVAGWGTIALWEFYQILRTNKVPALTYFGIIWAILFMLSPYCTFNYTLPVLLTSMVIFPLVYMVFRKNKEQAFTGWVWTVGGILFLGWLLSHWVALRGPLDGRNWVFLGLLVTFTSDSAAYLIGRKWGKHYLAPAISPKKTWEGAYAGIGGAVIVSLLFLIPTPLQLPFNWWQAIILGILVSVFGQLGDLAKSLFKRNMGVKDSSNMIPGHGGFLDRIDSIAFAGVVVYYYVMISGGLF